MGSTLLTIGLFIIAVAIGVGIAFFILPELLTFLDQQTQIIIAIVLVLFTFISLYFMTKSQGGG